MIFQTIFNRIFNRDSQANSEWFHNYMDQIEQGAEKERLLGENKLYQCPSCLIPTVGEPAGYEICPLCRWEDDGQSEDEIDEVWGGPNGGLSLRDSRNNYRNNAPPEELAIVDDYLSSNDPNHRLKLLYKLEVEFIHDTDEPLPKDLQSFEKYKAFVDSIDMDEI